jgi:hypothetical protein
MKFPDLIHAVKPEPHNEMPQAGSARDTFWDFISLTPEAMHMIMWVIRILDKKHGNVIADNIVVAFFGVEPYGKTPRIAGEVGRASRDLAQFKTQRLDDVSLLGSLHWTTGEAWLLRPKDSSRVRTSSRQKSPPNSSKV